MINRGIFNIDVTISIGDARALWRANERNPGSVPTNLLNRFELVFGRQNLDFHPQKGDILESHSNIIMFEGFTDENEFGKCVKSIFSLSKSTQIMEKIEPAKLITILSGYESEYVYATREHVKLFYDKIATLK